MALDPTARKANLKDSVKVYLVDSLETIEGIRVTFDTEISPLPDANIARWVTVRFGTIELGYMSECLLRVFLCVRNDSEGFKLAQLRDTVLGYFTDTTQSDGMRRIPFYRSVFAQPVQNWTLLGALLVQSIEEDGESKTSDDTKFLLLTVRLRWASKV